MQNKWKKRHQTAAQCKMLPKSLEVRRAHIEYLLLSPPFGGHHPPLRPLCLLAPLAAPVGRLV